MDYNRFDELKEAYVLEILSEQDNQEFEEYLAAHPERRPEVEDLRSAVNLLALSPAEQEPPPELRRTLMSVIEAEAPLPQEESGSFFTRLKETLTARRIAAGAAAAVLVVLVAWNVVLQTELQDARTYETLGSSATEQSKAQVLRLEDYGTVLVAESLPPLPQDKTYQIWAIKEGEDPVPSGLFRPDGDRAAAAIRSSLEDVETVAVTVEPSGGSEAPTTDPVLAVSL